MSAELPPDRFRLLVENATAYAVITFDLSTKIESWSPGAEALFGWSAAEAVGQLGELIFTPEDRAAGVPERERATAMQHGNSSDDRWHMRRDGSRFMANGMMIRLDAPDGRPIALGKILRDVTDRVRAEAALQESEERFRTIADSIPQLAWMADPAGATVWWNQRWFDYTGTNLETAAGWGWTESVHPDQRARVLQGLRQQIERGEPWETTLQLRTATGEYRWFLSQLQPIRDAAASVVRWFGTHTDITEQREREEALRHTQKLESLGVLAGGIAHDFNNLLTGILGNASLAAAGLSGESTGRLRPLLDEVVRSGRRAAELTQQLLAYAGKARSTRRQLDPCALVRESVGLLDVSLPPTVKLELAVERGCSSVLADPSQLQQVLLNLVMNAAESFEDRPGRVEVSVEDAELGESELAAFGPNRLPPGRYVRLRVRDDGSGMPPEVHARMFEPFFTTRFLGRGLGLSAVQGILRTHEGGIAVATAPGEGTTVSVILPAQPPALPAAGSGPGGAHLTVLVIDDEDFVRAVAREALAEGGHAAVEARDGAAGIALVEAAPSRFDVVLLDLTMPVMSGVETARRLRAAAPHLPIIAMSGYAAETALENLAGLRVGAALQKPFTVDELVAAVVGAAQRRR